jgi:hypothetical protein
MFSRVRKYDSGDESARKIGLKCVLRHKRAFLIDLLLKIKVQQEIQLLSPMMMSYLGFFVNTKYSSYA